MRVCCVFVASGGWGSDRAVLGHAGLEQGLQHGRLWLTVRRLAAQPQPRPPAGSGRPRAHSGLLALAMRWRDTLFFVVRCSSKTWLGSLLACSSFAIVALSRCRFCYTCTARGPTHHICNVVDNGLRLWPCRGGGAPAKLSTHQATVLQQPQAQWLPNGLALHRVHHCRVTLRRNPLPTQLRCPDMSTRRTRFRTAAFQTHPQAPRPP